MKPLIEITISPNGQTQVATRGFQGSSCEAASRFLEEALGKRMSSERTAEFYLHASTDMRISQQTDG